MSSKRTPCLGFPLRTVACKSLASSPSTEISLSLKASFHFFEKGKNPQTQPKKPIQPTPPMQRCYFSVSAQNYIGSSQIQAEKNIRDLGCEQQKNAKGTVTPYYYCDINFLL